MDLGPGQPKRDGTRQATPETVSSAPELSELLKGLPNDAVRGDFIDSLVRKALAGLKKVAPGSKVPLCGL